MVDLKGPSFPNPLRTPSDPQYDEIINRHVEVGKELKYVYEAITLTRRKLNGRVPLIGFCGAPWTLLCYMVEGGGTKVFFNIKTWIYTYPNACHRLLTKLAEVCVEHLALQVQAGAQVRQKCYSHTLGRTDSYQIVQVFDSWAGELSPSSFQQFSLPYLRYISAHLPKRLSDLGEKPVPMIVFAKGAWYALDALCISGYDVVGLDWLHDPAEAVRIASGRVVLQGNADPGLMYGNSATISSAVAAMVKGFGGGKQGWIVNLGHGISTSAKNWGETELITA